MRPAGFARSELEITNCDFKLGRSAPLLCQSQAWRVTIYTPFRGKLMADLADRITVNPAQCGGRPCVRGMRIRVVDVLELMASGLSPSQVLEELPDLETEDIAACLRFASSRLDHPILAA